MRGIEYAELNAFMMIARERNFRRAALRLDVSPSALSHTMRSLEERLGTRLLNRTTRSVSPTEAGLALLSRLEPAFAEVRSAVSAIGAYSDRPTGRVRINLPRLALALVFAPRLGRFAQAFPHITLDLVVDDGLTDVVAEGFDAGVRQGEQLHRDMVAVRLSPDERPAVVGSPGYFALRGRPKTPQDLLAHTCINYRFAGSGALYRWEFDSPKGRIQIAVPGSLIINDSDFILQAALQGAGLAYSSLSYAGAHLEDGSLERVLEEWCEPLSGFFLYYPDRKHVSASLRALIDFLRDDKSCV